MVDPYVMRLPLIIVGLLTSLVLFGCGGPKREAAVPESNPWADYKGTFAAGASPEPPSAAEAKAPSAAEAKPASAAPKPARVAAARPKATAAPSDAKAMYGVASDAKPEEDASKKATSKKRSKAGAKKAPGTRAKT